MFSNEKPQNQFISFLSFFAAILYRKFISFLFSLFVEHLNQDNLKLQSELFSSEKPQNSIPIEIEEEKFVQLQSENTELHGLITSLRLREERVNVDKNDCEDVLKLNEMLNKSVETKNAKIAECQEINRILEEKLMLLQKDLQSQRMLQKKYKKLKKHFSINDKKTK